MSFEQHFNYILTFQYYGILKNFCDFRVFVFGYRAQNKNSESPENLYFWVYKAQINVDLFFDHYFNFLSVKTDITKRESN